MSLSDLFTQVAHNPVLGLTCLLVLAVVLVNGWTDAPNAIATVVSTGVLSFRRAVALAAACNLLGVLVMTAINATVAETVYSIADFGPDRAAALSALCAALCAIVLWAVLAWRFGVPTSESHALVAGLTGAALALPGGLDNIRAGAWGRVLLGLVLSVALGWWVGGLCRRLLERLHPSLPLCRRGQLAGAGAMAFLHGAQDGQKFIGVLFLGMAFCGGQESVTGMVIPAWLMLMCSTVMGLGTSVGGEKIIKSVGMDMVRLEKYQGFAADLAAAACLLLSSLFGIPVSTTHTKTSAIMGVGAVKRLSAINFGVVKDMMLTWVFTFPGCGLISFVMAKIFTAIF